MIVSLDAAIALELGMMVERENVVSSVDTEECSNTFNGSGLDQGLKRFRVILVLLLVEIESDGLTPLARAG